MTDATLRLITGEEIPIEVEGQPMLINCWASELGIKRGKDSIIFAILRTAMGPLTYRQEEPKKATRRSE